MTQGIASIWTGLGMGIGGPFGGYIADRYVGLVCPPAVLITRTQVGLAPVVPTPTPSLRLLANFKLQHQLHYTRS